MAVQFVVEDGTGLATATAYLTTANADQYHENIGNDAWADASDAEKQVAINVATQFVDLHYRFRGMKKLTTQALEWPRDALLSRTELEFIDEDSVPVEVERATAELALASIAGVDLMPNSLGNQGSAQVLSETKKAGGLSVAKTFKEIQNLPIFHKARCILEDLLASDELLRA